MSELNSSQHMSNICPTINQSINQDSDSEEEAEKWRKWNENQIHKQMQTDKLEELAIAGKDNQVEI
ncbi:hypothetical protein ACOAJ8_06995 [Arcobacter cryaerophilus gv. pseudocryaerophilus]